MLTRRGFIRALAAIAAIPRTWFTRRSQSEMEFVFGRSFGPPTPIDFDEHDLPDISGEFSGFWDNGAPRVYRTTAGGSTYTLIAQINDHTTFTED